MPVYVQIASGVFALVVCGTPFLSGCGFVSRIQAWDTNQRIKANSGVARTAITEHLETQQLLGVGTPLPIVSGVIQAPVQSIEAPRANPAMKITSARSISDAYESPAFLFLSFTTLASRHCPNPCPSLRALF